MTKEELFAKFNARPIRDGELILGPSIGYDRPFSNETSVVLFDYIQAFDYFKEAKRYTTLKLPDYFDFQPLLDKVFGLMDNDKASHFKIIETAKNEDFINHEIAISKDGGLEWRKLKLIHPFLYCELVRTITREENWKFISGRVKELRDKVKGKIDCYSMPMAKDGMKKEILNWWKKMEQYSIVQSLDYDYIVKADIANCYDSLYTHTISWALLGKEEAKKDKRRKYDEKDNVGKLCADIDSIIMAMQYGQTNGIPQGSVLMNFVAEIVLAYADLLLFEELKKQEIEGYRVFRYRDDYRIFCKNIMDAQNILRCLGDVLDELNFKLNYEKTGITDEVIHNSVKPAKLEWLHYEKDANTLPKRLLNLLEFSREHRNCGVLETELSDIIQEVENDKVEHNGSCYIFKTGEAEQCVAILTELACINSRLYPKVVFLIGEALERLWDEERKKELVMLVKNKMGRQKHNSYFEVWLQRLTIKTYPDMEYGEKLCGCVKTKQQNGLWRTDWMEDIAKDYAEAINTTPVINEDILKNIGIIPMATEVESINENVY